MRMWGTLVPLFLFVGVIMGNGYTEKLAQGNKNADILNLVYALESSSGNNKNAYKENKDGALGGYQILRSTYEGDLQRRFPDKWGKLSFEEAMSDDNIAREAANDYLGIISDYLLRKGMAPTTDALLASYHSGMGNVAKGKPLGKRGREYLEKSRILGGYQQ